MRLKPDAVYWDACTFISLLDGGQGRTPEEIEGLREVETQFKKGEVRLFTSHLIDVEVLLGNMPPAATDQWTGLFRRRQAQLLSSDGRVSATARELREFYQRQSQIDKLPLLDQMDSIHLATAIHYKIPVFHTYDSGKKRSRSLLGLNGNVAGGRYPLSIIKPPPGPQRRIQGF